MLHCTVAPRRKVIALPARCRTQEGLAELVVRSADHVASLIEQGNKVRQVAETNMNARSSRSHSCFTIKIEQRTVEKLGDTERETALHAKINLVRVCRHLACAAPGLLTLLCSSLRMRV